ncbi:MAG: hypothetical protein LBQ92_04825 [Propionibacteriaceae bacterium]|jgi:hypothetical protein|nr:hypothetical protein [Propionibacteriaceae bacterium]
MSRWTPGEATVEQLLVAGELSRISKAASDAVTVAQSFIAAAEKLLPNVGFCDE